MNSLRGFVEFIDVCPEQGIGLGTPRNAIKLVGDEEKKFLMDPKTFKGYTKEMTEFANEISIDIECLNPQGFILKTKSPSCGISDVKIYKSLERGSVSVKGKGLFGEIICRRFSYLPIEDDGRLRDFNIKEMFYTKTFTLAKFKKIHERKSIGELVKFHGENKLLLMVYSQSLTKVMGQLVSNGRGMKNEEIFVKYSYFLNHIFENSSRHTEYINVFYKIFGYFSNNLEKREKEFFLKKISEFRKGKIPHKIVMTLIESYAIRFNNKYILNQSLLEPYPNELLDLDDSGKGIVR